MDKPAAKTGKSSKLVGPTQRAKTLGKKPRRKLSIAVRPADLEWVENEARRSGKSVSSLFTEAVRDLRRRRAAKALLGSFGDTAPLSDAMFAFHRAEQNGSDPDVSSIGDAWGRVECDEHDAEAHALVEHYAQERMAGRATNELAAKTLDGLRRLTLR